MAEPFVGRCLTCGQPYRIVVFAAEHPVEELCTACARHPECCRCGPEYRRLSIIVADGLVSAQAELIPDRVGAHACPP